MHLEPVESSVVAAIGYDYHGRKLFVEFVSGNLYRYFDVPASVHRDFMDASSKGEFLNDYILGAYEYEQIR
ncbi:KTSC domain-containing protein [Cupriavidus gilardii]|uniref:KTSC domain-containing protein n=1 Tax=Cupriavidus gilardii TaxID=82541 RepID=UPI001ABE0676|nr:KTSC domain-containing protein [Cupriavidus gilardii]MBO4121249.1 KTSC domain-containing protein [Cupriavidus gilardii]